MAYYYVVYLLFFLACYLIVWLEWPEMRWSRRAQTTTVRWTRRGLVAIVFLLGAVAVWIAVTGGRDLTLGSVAVSAHRPQNTLTGIWICAALYALCVWSPAVTRTPIPSARVRHAAATALAIGGTFVVGAAPLLWQAAQLIARGEIRDAGMHSGGSAPRGVDLLAPLLGPPLHPWLPLAGRAYTSAGLDRIEAVGWLGIVPVLLACACIVRGKTATGELRVWRIVALIFGLWALGPILTDRRIRYRAETAGDPSPIRALCRQRTNTGPGHRRRLHGARGAGERRARDISTLASSGRAAMAADCGGRPSMLGLADPSHPAGSTRGYAQALGAAAPGAVCEGAVRHRRWVERGRRIAGPSFALLRDRARPPARRRVTSGAFRRMRSVATRRCRLLEPCFGSRTGVPTPALLPASTVPVSI